VYTYVVVFSNFIHIIVTFTSQSTYVALKQSSTKHCDNNLGTFVNEAFALR